MKPAFVLGIDGLPYTLAQRLMAEGVMPNLLAVTRRGTLAQMHTTVPDFSCVAWTSFATGVNPGKHGIYGFQDLHPKDGHHYLPTVNDCQAPALWHEVGKAGGRSIVFNLPGTYPALPLRGKMVSGFVATDFDKSFYPTTFGQTLKSLGYRMDLDGMMGLGTPKKVEEVLWPVFEARKTAIRHLINNERWDLCIAVITETDRLQHFYLHTLEDEGHPQHEWTKRFYVELDKFIGEVAGMLDGKADLYMVSDHGFAVIRRQFIMQDILMEMGLTVESQRPVHLSPELIGQAKVICMDPGRFYINRKGGRFAGGQVEESEAEDILQALEEKLASLQDPDTGETVVNTIRRQQKGFWGPAAGYAPDLVAATKYGYYFRSFWHKKESGVKEIAWEANHVWNDAIVYTPYPMASEHQPMIWDVLPSVLQGMGVPLAVDVDGRDLRTGEQGGGVSPAPEIVEAAV